MKTLVVGIFWVMGVAVAGAGLVALVGLAGPRAESSETGAPAVTALPTAIGVTARQILLAYEANEIAADQVYKGQLVAVTGQVGNVGKDIRNRPYITLVGTGSTAEWRQVQCFLTDDAVSRAMALSKGDYVTVQGTVDGLMMNVLLRRCEVIR